MNSRTNVSTIFKRNDDNTDIIVAIVTDNLSKVKQLINSRNVNNVIDSKNNYTALHYAVTLPNNDITRYILDMGADPKIVQSENYNAYELSLRSGKKFIFDYDKNKLSGIITNLETDNSKLTNKVDELKLSNQYLSNSIDDYNKKLSTLSTVNTLTTAQCNSLKNSLEIKITECIKLKNDLEIKTSECVKLKHNLEESDKAFTNLLKKQKK